MKIMRVDTYRDGGTGSIEVEGPDGKIQYLVHGNNFTNARMDVTVGPFSNMKTPSIEELDDLCDLLWNFNAYEYAKSYGDESDQEVERVGKLALTLRGMIVAYQHHLTHTDTPLHRNPEKAIHVARKIQEFIDNDPDDLGGNKLDAILLDYEMMKRFMRPLNDSIIRWVRHGLPFDGIVENVYRDTEWKYPIDLIQMKVREYTLAISMDI